MASTQPSVYGATTRVSRRTLLRTGGAGVGLWFLGTVGGVPVAVEAAAVDGASVPVPSGSIPKFATRLLVPPVMPRAGTVRLRSGPSADYYEISLRQLSQQVLPPPWPETTVWGYGPTRQARTGPGFHHAPSFTIEARAGRPVRVRWANELVDAQGNHLPHLLPVDPTLHWANPPGGESDRDSRPEWAQTPDPYTGPVPMVTHVHGAVGVLDDSDGYPEAWYLPAAKNIPSGYATTGTWYEFFAGRAAARYGVQWGPGFAVQQYPNVDRASTNWYHDHTLGITRLNVYTGPAGFYIIRGGPDDVVLDDRTGTAAVLPGPAPKEGDKFPPNKPYREIPLAIQDRSFDEAGQLWYPDTRAYFDGYEGPYIPETDVSPMWNPEFFGNTLVVNGAVWPSHTVEQARYRFRALNGCQSRFLILDFGGIPGVRVSVIGNEGGFLDGAAVDLAAVSDNRLLLAPAERADLIVDFTGVPVGSWVLRNVGPDAPFGGGSPEVDFDPADPEGAGTVMQLVVVRAKGADPSTPAAHLVLPTRTPVGAATVVRQLALVEMMSEVHDGPAAALLGVVDGDPNEGWAGFRGAEWMEAVTENPTAGVPEVWEVYNTTEDAHPIHVHDVAFEVVNRQPIELDEEESAVRVMASVAPAPPEPWESGVKDVVTAYPGQVTRIRVRFDHDGTFVWHCHVLEHEDNEMMRPLRVGPVQPGAPGGEPLGH